MVIVKPTWDDDAEHELEKIHVKYCGGDDHTMLQVMLRYLEKRGYRREVKGK